MLDEPVIIRLIRHGKTEANIGRKYIGSTDESIIEQLKPISFEQKNVYTSALKRTQETAIQYFPNAQIIPFQELNEIDFGNFEMKTYDELKSIELYRNWLSNPELVTPPNGESFHQFQERVLKKVEQIVSTKGEYVFVVHGGVIRLLLAQYAFPKQTFQQIHASHGEVYELVWHTFENWKEGALCTSFSVENIMEKRNIQ